MSGRRKKALDVLRRALMVGTAKARAFRKFIRRQQERPLSPRQLKVVDASMWRAKRFREQADGSRKAHLRRVHARISGKADWPKIKSAALGEG